MGVQVVPQLSVRHGTAAVRFYEQALGAEVVYRVGGESDDDPVVAQLQVGGAPFWVSDESPDTGHTSPEGLGGTSVRLLLQVDDPAVLVDRAVAAGATLVHPVQDEHGWRLGRLRDPYGHDWEVGSPL